MKKTANGMYSKMWLSASFFFLNFLFFFCFYRRRHKAESVGAFLFTFFFAFVCVFVLFVNKKKGTKKNKEKSKKREESIRFLHARLAIRLPVDFLGFFFLFFSFFFCVVWVTSFGSSFRFRHSIGSFPSADQSMARHFIAPSSTATDAKPSKTRFKKKHPGKLGKTRKN